MKSAHQKFGEIAVSKRFISREQLNESLLEQQSHPDWPIGLILQQLGYLTELQVNDILAIQAKTGRTIGLPAPEYFGRFQILEKRAGSFMAGTCLCTMANVTLLIFSCTLLVFHIRKANYLSFLCDWEISERTKHRTGMV